MHVKRTTAADSIRGALGPPGPPVKLGHPPQPRPITAAGIARLAVELVRRRARLSHRPTLAQLHTMARLDGREPYSYRLDRAANWLPESLPQDFPHGAIGLCFAHPGGEVVVLPTGWGFSLT